MALKETAKFEPINLFAENGICPVVVGELEIGKTQKLKVGALIDSKGKQVAASGEDIYGVLAVDADTTGGKKVCPLYLMGEFNAEALSLSESGDIKTVVAAARKVGIFIRGVLPEASEAV